ncbi:hypothetical protein BVAVS116_E0056 (plasmid) [Borreliella valaisiana VS116]|uniref:Uncharacterized protein n=1 Tax=Borreliella valaisiana VS116 TaxID=445987 RepID=C0R8T7_BORVA|nr:hypothetical protein BVAVS116_E0056 [Borreliella valaisiana VS116]
MSTNTLILLKALSRFSKLVILVCLVFTSCEGFSRLSIFFKYRLFIIHFYKKKT